LGQMKGDDGGKYGKAHENKRDNNIEAYVETGMFHAKCIWCLVFGG
jgi:hypothetical protein